MRRLSTASMRKIGRVSDEGEGPRFSEFARNMIALEEDLRAAFRSINSAAARMDAAATDAGIKSNYGQPIVERKNGALSVDVDAASSVLEDGVCLLEEWDFESAASKRAEPIETETEEA